MIPVSTWIGNNQNIKNCWLLQDYFKSTFQIRAVWQQLHHCSYLIRDDRKAFFKNALFSFLPHMFKWPISCFYNVSEIPPWTNFCLKLAWNKMFWNACFWSYCEQFMRACLILEILIWTKNLNFQWNNRHFQSFSLLKPHPFLTIDCLHSDLLPSIQQPF